MKIKNNDMDVVIYEDDEKLRESLSILIDGTVGYSVKDSFGNCKNVIEEIKKLTPNIVLMDIDMPVVNGIEGVKKIKGQFPFVKVLMYTVFDDDDKLFSCLKAGADGYLLKRTSPAKLLEALKDVYSGGAPMSPGIALRVLKTFHELTPPPEDEYDLTSRQKEVLKLLVEGYTYLAISDKLYISKNTVTTHLQNIYRKLHVQSAPQAVVKAIKEGLL